MNKTHHLNGLFHGKIKQSYGMETAIEKSRIDGDIYLSFEGLEGDECADKKNHGGLDRALHQYPSEHYSYWRKKYNLGNDCQEPGMGENLSSTGMTEDTVYIGDRYSWGDAIIEVSQPRSPCFKLSRRWGVEDLSVHMQEIARCGWLYRVVQPGTVSAANPLVLVERVPNALSIQETCDLYFGSPLDSSSLHKLMTQKGLAESWMNKISKRLETGELENWNFRLLGHA